MPFQHPLVGGDRHPPGQARQDCRPIQTPQHGNNQSRTLPTLLSTPPPRTRRRFLSPPPLRPLHSLKPTCRSFIAVVPPPCAFSSSIPRAWSRFPAGSSSYIPPLAGRLSHTPDYITAAYPRCTASGLQSIPSADCYRRIWPPSPSNLYVAPSGQSALDLACAFYPSVDCWPRQSPLTYISSSPACSCPQFDSPS